MLCTGLFALSSDRTSRRLNTRDPDPSQAALYTRKPAHNHPPLPTRPDLNICRRAAQTSTYGNPR